jgi:helix-turn-helix protein
MWTLFEPVHAVTYFAPEARSAFEQAGLRGFWRGYFAGRAARPWARLGAETADSLATLLTPLAQACATGMPYPSPIGVPAPGTVS